MTQRVEYTEEMVGNAHPTKSDTLNRFVNLITAAGDSLVGTAAATAARLAIGAANTKRFVNAAGTGQEWALGMKMTAHTYDLATASGDQTLPGAGFTPTSVILSWGLLNYTSGIGRKLGAIVSSHIIIHSGAINGTVLTTGLIITASISVGNQQTATLVFNTDGGVLTWTKTGSPTGTLSIAAQWFR